MFFKNDHLKERFPLVQYQGIFRRQINVLEGVALIVSSTIGAGVLSLPYAIARVGVVVGLAYIIGIGMLMMGLNLLVGEIAVRTQGNMQFVGLARKYLGPFGQWLMTVIVYVVVVGVMVIYMIGEGRVLAQFFGGSEFIWSIVFFCFGSIFIYLGLKTVKLLDFILSLLVLAVILLITSFILPHAQIVNYQYNNLASLFLPYGIVLFAYSGMSSVLEAHSLLANHKQTFKKVIIISGIIVMLAYGLFTFAVLGATGQNTTEIATIGLGKEIGPIMTVLGNIFSLLVLATGFLMVGLSTKDSLCWDYKLSSGTATALVCGLPLLVFLLGLRQFVMVIDIIGGVFLSLEMIIILLIYWRAKEKGDLKPGRYRLHHTVILMMLLALALSIGAVYSIVKLF